MKQTPELWKIGEVYKVKHCRKGVFRIKVLKVGEEWLEGIICEGQTNAMNGDNAKFEGDEITVRKSFLTILINKPETREQSEQNTKTFPRNR